MKTVNKLTAISIAVAGVLSCAANADVMITEIAEGAGSNKVIELYNPGETAADLSQYKIVQYNNQNKNLMVIDVPLEGTLPAKGVLVIAKANSDFTGEATTANLQFNGKDGDAVALQKGDDVVDLVGTIRGDSETPAVDVLADRTLERLDRIASPIFFDASWKTLSKDDLSGFGVVGEPSEPEPTPDAIQITIPDLQGEGWSSEYVDVANNVYESEDFYEVEGVVTAIQSQGLSKGLSSGFFIQDENGDDNPKTSDGIFVNAAATNLEIGDVVTVTAKVLEDYGFTTLVEPTIVKADRTVTMAATPLRTIESDENFDASLERHEGMFVKFDAEAKMNVTRTFGFDFSVYRNNMVLSHDQINLQPNQNNFPGTQGADDQAACNQEKRVVVESFFKAGNGQVPYYSDFAKDNGTGTTENYIRIGDTVNGLEGVMAYGYNEFRFYVTNTATDETFVHNSPRTETPVIEDGNIKVATFNVLNYFNSPFGGDCNPLPAGSRDSVKDGECSNRGARSVEEFEQQSTKIANAIVALDADIIGLMEIENNGFGEESAVFDLVTKVNDLISNEEDQYTLITKEGVERVGSDAITNQVIYRASKVTLDDVKIIEMPQQHAPSIAYVDGTRSKTEDGNNYQRDAITPTFTVNGVDEKLTVSVNHFKSKGSTCYEDIKTITEDGEPKNILDNTDRQGNCENFRVSAAYHLGTELAKIEGHKLILGDLNSYASEDPIVVLTSREGLPTDYEIKAARDTYISGDATTGTPLHGAEGAVITESFGYANVIKDLHPGSVGYSYNDEMGTLDYILTSASLKDHVVDATEWNINSFESTLLEYSKKNTGDLVKFNDIYRSSDHDPAIVSLSFEATPVDPTDPTDPTDPVEPEKPSKKSSGSTGIFSMLALLSLGLLRRKRFL